MIIVKIFGGLGNQMFQYAFGKSLALKYGCELYLDISYYDKQNYPFGTHSTYYPFMLEKYNISEKTTSNVQTNYVNVIRRKKLYTLMNPLLARFGTRKSMPYYINHSNFNFNLLENVSNVYLDGYWQHMNIIDECKTEIRGALYLKDISLNTSRIVEKIRGENSVSIHFRKGDYLSNPRFKAVYTDCSIDYYNKAMDYIASLDQNVKYYIFTDNVSWVSENISIGADMQIIGTEIPDHEQQYLMSCCNHNIIANSSFSWWGAWLNVNSGKNVIAPSQWFKAKQGDYNKQPFYPNSWILLEQFSDG